MPKSTQPIKAAPSLLKRIEELAEKSNVEVSIMTEIFLQRSADDFEAGDFSITQNEPNTNTEEAA